MSRKVYVDVKVRLVIRADEGQPINEVLHNMDYNFTSQTPGADIEDTDIGDWEVVDSK